MGPTPSSALSKGRGDGVTSYAYTIDTDCGTVTITRENGAVALEAYDLDINGDRVPCELTNAQANDVAAVLARWALFDGGPE